MTIDINHYILINKKDKIFIGEKIKAHLLTGETLEGTIIYIYSNYIHLVTDGRPINLYLSDIVNLNKI